MESKPAPPRSHCVLFLKFLCSAFAAVLLKRRTKRAWQQTSRGGARPWTAALFGRMAWGNVLEILSVYFGSGAIGRTVTVSVNMRCGPCGWLLRCFACVCSRHSPVPLFQSDVAAVSSVMQYERAISAVCGGNALALLRSPHVTTWWDALWGLLSSVKDAKLTALLVTQRSQQLQRTRSASTRARGHVLAFTEMRESCSSSTDTSRLLDPTSLRMCLMMKMRQT